MHIPHTPTLSFAISFKNLLKYKPDAHAQGPRGAPPAFMFVELDSPEMLASLNAYQRFLGAMDEVLADNPYLAGPAFSLADIDVVPYVWRLQNLHLTGLWNTMPRVQQWLDRVVARRSFQEQIVETALPEWVASMRSNGKEAWPTIERLLQSA